jgi:hypothetical protein
MAGTINIGFESPDYFPGNINGQQGWSNTSNFDAQVTSTAGYEGSQSMRISNAISSGAYGNQPFTPPLLSFRSVNPAFPARSTLSIPRGISKR